MSHGSRVTRVTGQLTDGSCGSWVIKFDPLSALLRAMNPASIAHDIIRYTDDLLASCQRMKLNKLNRISIAPYGRNIRGPGHQCSAGPSFKN